MLALEFDIDKLKAASYEDGIEDGDKGIFSVWNIH